MNTSTKIVFCSIISFLLVSSIAAAQEDAEGCKDHPLLTRMPGYRIGNCEEKEFDQYKFQVGTPEKNKEVPIEGHFYRIEYDLKEGEKNKSELQQIRNYTNAIKKIGGTVTYEDSSRATFKVEKGGRTTWIDISAGPISGKSHYELLIVEVQAMAQEVVADAKSMAADISATGKVAIYGIYFDTNKADVKPESDTTLKEIANLLSQDSKLKLYVVGHTDNVGEFDHNLKLSQSRAEAVVKALVSKHKADASRLKPLGAGQMAPVASNKTEDGRAKNRRVELVEQ